MKKLATIIISLFLLYSYGFAQSNHTVTFSGNASDFNSAEKYSAALANTDYYTTFDATYLYVGAFRTGGNTFAGYDHFTVYVDSDPNSTPTSGTGSTTGVNWDNQTPTLPFSANYRIVLRNNNFGESFYSYYSSGSWTTSSANGQSWTQYATSTALEVRVPWTDLGSPSGVYLTNYMSYGGGGGGFYSPAPGSISGTTVSGYFGYFSIQSGVTPNSITNTPFSALPVELSTFTASLSNSAVELNWKTATEVNNYGFEVQRAASSKQSESLNWEKIGFVNGAGNSSSPRQYSFTDKGITFGNYSYRLKQIDVDGQYKYSSVVNVSAGQLPNGFVLNQNYPNPFNPSTQIQFGFNDNTRATLTVYNVLGQKVASLFDGVAQAGQLYNITFNGDNFASGIYYYKLQSNNNTQIKKMLLMK